MRFWIRQDRTKDSGSVPDVPRPTSPAMMYLRLAADQQEELVVQEISRPRRIAAFMVCGALALFVPLGLAKNAFAKGTHTHAHSVTKIDFARKNETGGSEHELHHHRHLHGEGDQAGGGGSNTGGTHAGGQDSTQQGTPGGSNTGGTQAGGQDSTQQGTPGGSNTGGTQAGNESTQGGHPGGSNTGGTQAGNHASQQHD